MTWEPIDLNALDNDPAPRPTLGGLIYPGGRHVFSGEPESAKTIVAFALGLEEVRDGGIVLHVDFEMYAKQTRNLLREMGATDADLRSWIHVEPDAPPPKPGVLENYAYHGVTLAIIDAAAGAYAIAGLDDNKRGDVEKFHRMLVQPLHSASVAAILIDHLGRDREKRGKFAIGSERKLGGCDVHLGLETSRPFRRGSSSIVRVTVHKDRHGYLPRPRACDIHLESDAETHAITWQFEPVIDARDIWQPTALMEKVSTFLAAQTEPVPRSRIEAAKLGKRIEYVRQAIDDLIVGGYVKETLGPNKARLCSHVRPFTQGGSSQLVPVRPDEDVSSSSGSSAPSKGDEHEDEHAGRARKPEPSDELVTAAQLVEILNRTAKGAA